jgi:antitoxin (DNA-binding transcriptional repressor) of toxin-antitoxin stability system
MAGKPRNTRSPVRRIGMAEARLRLPELAAALREDPDRVVEVTRRGRPVLHLVAPPRVEGRASEARHILQRVAQLDRAAPAGTRDVARRIKELLYERR